MNKNNILMSEGRELTAEEKENIKQLDKKQDEVQKDFSDKQLEEEKEVKMVTLEELMRTKIEPREDRVVVYPDPVATVTSGGIIKPQEVIDRERPLFGTVIAVGPGKKVDQTVTNVLLLNLLQFGSDIPQQDLDKLKAQIQEQTSPLYPGMRVMYGKFAGTPTCDPDTKTDVLIMRPDDIFAKIK
jgi:co-chaperonin GroES (HSP10)